MDEAVTPKRDASDGSPGSCSLQPRGNHLLCVLGDAALGCLARRQAASGRELDPIWVCDELADRSHPQSSLQVGPPLAAGECLDSDSDFFRGELPLHRRWGQLITTAFGTIRELLGCRPRTPQRVQDSNQIQIENANSGAQALMLGDECVGDNPDTLSLEHQAWPSPFS